MPTNNKIQITKFRLVVNWRIWGKGVGLTGLNIMKYFSDIQKACLFNRRKRKKMVLDYSNPNCFIFPIQKILKGR